MLVILRHDSTHLSSHPYTLLNLRLFTVKYCMIARLRYHWLAISLNKADKRYFKKVNSDKDKTVFSRKVLVVTNVLYTYRQNTTVVLDVVYLLVLRYMFRPMLGHHQALWRYIV
jgi:hypothetical protein